MHNHPINKLASELTDLIIDHLPHDKASLAACGLAWRAWVPRTRYHLFRSIYLTYSNHERLLQILNFSPRIGSYIEHFNFCAMGTGKDEDDDADDEGDSLGEVPLAALQILASHLFAVQTLYVSGVAFDEELLGAIFGRGFDSLKGFDVVNCRFPSFHHFTEVLYTLPSLENLWLYGTSWADEECTIYYDHSHRKRSALRWLTILGLEDESQFLSWILEKSWHLGLHHLALSVTDSSQLNTIGNLIGGMGSSLTEIDMSFHEFKASEMTPEVLKALRTSITLAHNDHLRIVSIHVSQLSQLPFIALLLAQITATDVEEITLAFLMAADDRGTLATPDFGQITTILSHPRFLHLRKLCLNFDIEPFWDYEKVKQWVREELNELDARGVLDL